MPTTEEMKMRRPRRIRIMPRTARLATRYAPARLVSSTSAKSSSPISASSVSRVTPALATSTSTGPWLASTAEKAASTDAASRTSHRTTATPSTGSPEREVTVTLSPSAANRRAMASPIPRFPPVTSTERPMSTSLIGHLRLPQQARAGEINSRRVDDSRIDPEFTALPLRELADAALAHARSLGAQHADFRAERIRGQQIGLSDGTPQTLFDADDSGLAVRVIVDGTWGFASAVDLTADAAAQAAQQAVEVARVAAAMNTEPIELAPEPAYGEVSWVSAYDTDPFTVSVADKVALLAQWSRDLLAHPAVSHVDASLQQVQECKFYSDGATTAIQQRVRLHPAITAIAVTEDGRFDTMRTLAPPVGRGYEFLTGAGWDFAAELAELPDLLAAKLQAPSVEPGHYDLVIDPSNLWLTIHESIGHATELDRALGYEAA